MAYVILNPNETDKTQVYKIAENDAEKNNLNINGDFQVISVSDVDFNNFKKRSKRVTGHDGTNYTWETAGFHETKESLDALLLDYAQQIKYFLDTNPNHADYNFWNTYKNTCETYSTSDITYPMTGSWEEYCESQSIPYKGILQLP